MVSFVTFFWFEAIEPDELQADEDMCRVVGSLKYLRANFAHHASEENFYYEALRHSACFWKVLLTPDLFGEY